MIMSRDNVRLSKTVLIVDSDLNLRLSLALILKRAGYSVTTVGRACEACERLKADQFDLIILDVLTIDNKLTLLPQILQEYPKTATLAFTAQWSPETAAELQELGISAHLEKPVTPNSLLEEVEKIIEHHSKIIKPS
jgi:DNA-binding NtrC family response regulator